MRFRMRKADAQFNLWWRSINVEGVPQTEILKSLLDDPQKAAWFREAAEQGNADAQFNLGFLYDNGWGCAPGLCTSGVLVSQGC